MSERRLAIKRKVSLANISEGWDDCYVLIRPFTYGEGDEFMAANKQKRNKEQAEAFIREILSEHFVGGKIRVENVEGQEELQDMTVDDLWIDPSITKLVLSNLWGAPLNPKGTLKAA